MLVQAMAPVQQAAEAEEEAEGLYESPSLLLNVDELPELLSEVRGGPQAAFASSHPLLKHCCFCRSCHDASLSHSALLTHCCCSCMALSLRS